MIDLRAAYAHFDREMLLSVVVNIHIKAPKLTAILKSLHTDTEASINISIETFQVHTG